MQQYANVLIPKLLLALVIVVILLSFLIGFSIKFFKLAREGSKISVCFMCFCIVLALIVFVVGGKMSLNYCLDLYNQSYIVYEGIVEIGTYYGIGPIAKLDDERKTWLFIGDKISNLGKYKGTLVYAEHSKTVVLWTPIEGESEENLDWWI